MIPIEWGIPLSILFTILDLLIAGDARQPVEPASAAFNVYAGASP